jgi:DHA1 family tetracycline resistance protein-like MFS transporter
MLWMIASTASQALMTRRVGKNEQGELQGAIQMLRSVGMMVGPVIFTGAFAYSISPAHTWQLPSAAWIVGAVLLFGSMLLAWSVTNAGDNVHGVVDTAEPLETALPAEVPVAKQV